MEPVDFSLARFKGKMDCRIEGIGSGLLLGFTRDGSDECDPASGRGWAKVNGKQMEGYIFFHFGDDSGFTAKKVR